MSAKVGVVSPVLGDKQKLLISATEKPTSSNAQWHVPKILPFGVLVFVLTLFATRSSLRNPAINQRILSPSDRIAINHHKLPMAKTQYEKCSSIIASETRHFGYNLTAEDTAAHQWHFLDSAPAESRGRFRGEVTVNRGDLFQSSDIEVRVIVASNTEADLENVLFHQSGSVLGLDYVVTNENEICTDVQVVIFLRPWPKRLLDVLEVRSEVLDITFNEMLNWHVNDLIIHTSHGDSWYNSSHCADPLVAHNVATSSISGQVFGEYVANGNLTARNEHGPVGIALIPLYGRPFKPESISVSTLSGTIHVEAEWAYPDWPRHPYTHITNIHTRSGELYAYIPHGSYTNLSSIEELIVTRLQPFGTSSPTDLSEIYTSSGVGYMYVRVDDADPDSLKDLYDPLCNTTSKHYLGRGTMEVRYPYSWFGNVEASIEHGPLMFESTALEDFERSEGYVKARRGNNGESQLDVQVGTGNLDIQLGM